MSLELFGEHLKLAWCDSPLGIGSQHRQLTSRSITGRGSSKRLHEKLQTSINYLSNIAMATRRLRSTYLSATTISNNNHLSFASTQHEWRACFFSSFSSPCLFFRGKLTLGLTSMKVQTDAHLLIMPSTNVVQQHRSTRNGVVGVSLVVLVDRRLRMA